MKRRWATKSESLGPLPRWDPLYRFLTDTVFPGTEGRGDFEVFRMNSSEAAVYLYVNGETRSRVVGKFYGRKWLPRNHPGVEDLRSVLLDREFVNLARLRESGFDAPPYLVPRPLATSDAIDWVLLEEYVHGVNLHNLIWQKTVAEGPLLERAITMAGELLARLHAAAPPENLLPAKDPMQSLEEFVADLRRSEIVTFDAADRILSLGSRWTASGVLAAGTPSMVHGDPTAEHFIYDHAGRRIHAIDFESLRHGDPAEDLGYLAGEIKHLFWQYSSDRWESETSIGALYRDYARAAGLTESELRDLTDRARFFMACAELRIARNAWLPADHRHSLAAEAERCLMT